MTTDPSATLSNIMASAAFQNLPKFSGGRKESAKRFLEIFHSHATAWGLSVNQIPHLFSLSLKEEAEIWYRTLPNGLPFAKVTQLFLERFTPRNITISAIARLASEAYKEDEDLLTFLDRMRLIAITGEVSEEVLMALVQKSVPPEFQRALMYRNVETPLTWDYIYKLGKAYDEEGRISRREESISAVFHAQSKERRTVMPSKQRKAGQEKFCKFHKTRGHSTSECRTVKRVESLKQATYTTHVQEEHGKYSPRDENKPSLDYTTIRYSDTLPFCRVDVFNVRTKALIDSGSQSNLIRLNGNIPIKRIKKCALKVSTANGKQLKVCGQIDDLQVTIKGTTIQDKFIVIKDLKQECILGWSFLKKCCKGFLFEEENIKFKIKNPGNRVKSSQVFCSDTRAEDIESVLKKGKSNAADFLSRATYNTFEDKENGLTKQDTLKIIENYHHELGHGSIGNMLYNLRRKYSWDTMIKDVKEYVEKCHICRRAGNEVTTSVFTPIQTFEKNELWVIDLIGPLPTTEDGNRYILSIIDHFSKYAHTAAIHSRRTEIILEHLEKACAILGHPKRILSDNAREFNNEVCQKWAEQKRLTKDSRLQWVHGSPYHPQSQGAVERFNQTLISKLKKLSEFREDIWDRQLQAATKAYNNSLNRAIDCAPVEIWELSKPNFNIDDSYGVKPVKLNAKSVQDNVLKKRASYLKEFSRGRGKIHPEFKAGDEVLYFDNREQVSKLGTKWNSGYHISREHGEGTYELQNGLGQAFIANKMHIKPNPIVQF